MARSITDIEKELMALPSETRKRIAHDLIISLDNHGEQLSREEWEAAWLEDINRRVEDIATGKVNLLDGEQVMSELKAKYRKN